MEQGAQDVQAVYQLGVPALGALLLAVHIVSSATAEGRFQGLGLAALVLLGTAVAFLPAGPVSHTVGALTLLAIALLLGPGLGSAQALGDRLALSFLFACLAASAPDTALFLAQTGPWQPSTVLVGLLVLAATAAVLAGGATALLFGGAGAVWSPQLMSSDAALAYAAALIAAAVVLRLLSHRSSQGTDAATDAGEV